MSEVKFLLTAKISATHPRTVGIVKITRSFKGVDSADAFETFDKFIGELKAAKYTILSKNMRGKAV
mgnify:FL=1